MTKEVQEFVLKQKQIMAHCYYGFNHFCDGTPNKSMGDITEVRPPCPKRFNCKIKETKICKTLEEERQ